MQNFKKLLSLRKKNKLLIGWNEWCTLPQLNIPVIKAKIDTGAKTSSLHAFDIEEYKRHNHLFVRFSIHPLQVNKEITITCHAPVHDKRYIMSSNGHEELRYVIKTLIQLDEKQWEIEMTLSNRDPLRYRMLLGREALRGKAIVDPQKRFCLQKITKLESLKFYN